MRLSYALLLWPTLLSACGEKDTGPTDDSNPPAPEDADQDGYPGLEDCDDQDPTINPGAEERCDGVDQDCDGVVDEDVTTSAWYADDDGDGHGDPADSVDDCAQPEGWVATGDDCDDTDAGVYPGAPESCNLADDDCDGEADEEEDLRPEEAWYPDSDGDGYGDDTQVTFTCDPPEGYVSTPGDCDDTRSGTAPGRSEACDGLDNDCDDSTDESPATDERTWYTDGDGDTYGSLASTVQACSPPEGFVENPYDCDDTDAAVNPDAVEICDNLRDDDCDDAAPACDMSGDLLLTIGSAARMAGENDEDYLGYALQGATRGDHDGDGIPDLVTGAPGYDELAGAVYVVDGASMSGIVNAASVTARLLGTTKNDYFGELVAWAGDVATDSSSGGCTSCDDLLVGADRSDLGGTNAGAMFLYIGPVGNGEATSKDAWAIWLGASARDYAGSSGSGAGDFNGDGAADLILGAIGVDSSGAEAGAVYVVFGPVAQGTDTLDNADLILTGVDAGDGAGSFVSSGDLDGDGRDDVLVGAQKADGTKTSSGAAYVVLGSTTPTDGSLGAADVLLYGSTNSDGFGTSGAVVGDADGDGYLDLVLGAPGQDSAGSGAGAAYIFLGPLSGTLDADADASFRLLGVSAGDGAGSAVAPAGDCNADDHADILVGAPNAQGRTLDSGAAYLLYGDLLGSTSTTLSAADAVFQGGADDDYAGQAVAGPGDLNSDGYDDMLFGAWGADDSATANGTVYMVEGQGH